MSEEKVSIKDLLCLSGEEMRKPLPIPTAWPQPFWDAAKERRLVLKKCSACGNIDHPPYDPADEHLPTPGTSVQGLQALTPTFYVRMEPGLDRVTENAKIGNVKRMFYLINGGI